MNSLSVASQSARRRRQPRFWCTSNICNGSFLIKASLWLHEKSWNKCATLPTSPSRFRSPSSTTATIIKNNKTTRSINRAVFNFNITTFTEKQYRETLSSGSHGHGNEDFTSRSIDLAEHSTCCIVAFIGRGYDPSQWSDIAPSPQRES